MRSRCLYIFFVCVDLYASENHLSLVAVREQRIAVLQSQIAKTEQERSEAIECRDDSRDPIDRQVYMQNVVFANLRIQELLAQLREQRLKP